MRPRHPRNAPAAPECKLCKNCGGRFRPRVPWQECCSDDCRKKFWKYRGPAAAQLQDYTRKEIARQLAPLLARLAALEGKTDAR